MKTPIALTAVALALFTMSCNSDAHGTKEPHEHQAEGAGQMEQDPADGDHDHAEAGSDIPGVSLDNGKRWAANAETTEGIAKMSALIAGYDRGSGDPNALKTALEKEFSLIFERCTMTGEAHAQLHNYLLPIHRKLSDIDLSNAKELDELHAYLGTYGNYFE